MEGSLSGRGQNADVADTLHIWDVAMATSFWLSMGNNFGCVIAISTLFDSRGWVFRVKLYDEDIANFDLGGPKESCIRWSLDPAWEWAILRGDGVAHCKVHGHSALSCAKTAEPIKIPFRLWVEWAQGIMHGMGVQISPLEAAILRGKGGLL